jgi:opacity protein-like surface antigen
MKKILAALVLSAALAPAAHAAQDVLMYMSNKNGGTIQFTNIPCTDKGWRVVTVAGTGAIGMKGCWVYSEPNLITTYDDGTVYAYNVDDVKLTTAGKREFGVADSKPVKKPSKSAL